MGFSDASSVQRYFKDGSRNGKYLPQDLVEKFAKAFVGLGTPEITESDVWQLVGPVGKTAIQPEGSSNNSLDDLLKLYRQSTAEVKEMFNALYKSGVLDAVLQKKTDGLHTGAVTGNAASRSDDTGRRDKVSETRKGK